MEEVVVIINKNPELVNCIAKQPSQKDDGQLPLHVAFKTMSFDIAKFLIDNGANVNTVDSYGVDCLERFCMCINEHWISKPQPFFKETIEELSPILQLLINSGVDIHRKPTSEWVIRGNEY